MALTVGTIDPGQLRPFVSFVVLEYTGTDLARPIPIVKSFLAERASRGRGAVDREVVADTLQSFEVEENNPIPDEIDAFVYRKSQPPSWASGDGFGPLRDVTYDLVTLLRRDSYVAVGGAAEFRDALDRWIRGPLQPPLRLIPDLVLEQAFLRGEAKGLWLSGTHHRSRNKADTKNLTGIDLHDSLTRIEDGSYALTSGRAALPAGGGRTALVGVVGTTPGRSVVWNGPAYDFNEFVTAGLELLELVALTTATGAHESALPQLAASVTTLAGVTDAYEVLLPTPDEVASRPGVTDDQVAAAWELDGAIIDIQGRADGPSLQLVVGHEGSEVGRLAVEVSGVGRAVKFDYLTVGAPSDPLTLGALRDALGVVGDLNIYYESGHVIRERKAFLYRIPEAPFQNWRFCDFTGFDVAIEKPFNAKATADIHAQCGTAGDNSLFGWIVQTYKSGLLICDDGAGEIADFLHLADDDTLSLIHVKAAHSASAYRSLAVGPYEVVASQATKNLAYLDQARLIERLEPTRLSDRAAWDASVRCADRTSFLDALAKRARRAPSKVAIVQPHVTKSGFEAAGNSPGVSGYRLRLLDSLLNGTAATIAQASGATLEVIGAG